MNTDHPADRLQPENGWAIPATPRLPPPARRERGVLFRTVSRVSGLFGRPQVPDIFSVLHVNARLFWPWLLFASQLMPFGRLTAADREKIILRTAWNCRSRYEWGQHIEIALKAGVTDDDIVSVAKGPAAFADRHTCALMQACDDVFLRQCIADSTWDILSETFSRELLIEIVMLIGHYIMLAGFLNTAGIALEAPLEKTLQDFHQRLKP
ncbi:MAG: carboxymuconolactone decarboxylase family protein [bacterium]|nr:carboxymuconolactone decarboxylase family protein [bacterium]